MNGRLHVTVNLPADAGKDWDRTRIGYPHTNFAMAGLAAIQLLDSAQWQTLMSLVGAVQERRAAWTEVLAWIEQERERAIAARQAFVEEAAAELDSAARRAKQARGGKRSKRRSG